MDFYVNRGGDNLHLQITKQIDYYIAVGELVVGDRLPTIRELEKQLGVNRHTIRKAYLDLERKGLLQVRRGSGVTVVAGLTIVEKRKRDTRIDELVEKTLEEAARMGCSPLTFSRMVKPRALEMDHRDPSLAFVECNDAQAHDLARALEAYLGQAVVGINLNSAIKDASVVPQSVQYVVVPAFHAVQIREVLKQRTIQILTVRVEIGQRFRSMAEKLLPTDRPCMILRDQDSVALLPNLVKRILGLEREVVPVIMSKKREAEHTVERSDLVFYTAPCRKFMEEVVPAGKKKQEVFFEFPPDALELVRQSVWT